MFIITILSDHRNGSTYLMKLLSNLKGCVCYDEPFDSWHHKHEVTTNWTDNLKNHQFCKEHGEVYISEMIKDAMDAQVIVFKMNRYQGYEYWEYLLTISDLVIFTYRQDSLASIKSYDLAFKNHEYYKTDTTNKLIHLPLKHLENQIFSKLKLHIIQREAIRNYPFRILTYEQLHNHFRTDEEKFDYLLKRMPELKPYVQDKPLNVKLTKQDKNTDIYANIENALEVKLYMEKLPKFLRTISV
ncbi:TPA_asm: sulfotransferase [Monosiga MELD virus 2]|nr:TPA_asm: sulfotransferase [Monosiga MELD virus 2]